MTTTLASGAAAEIAASNSFSSPGSTARILASATATAFTQKLVGRITQVAITGTNPTSLPPIVIETSVVTLLSAESWPLSTEPIVASAHASEANEAGWLAAAHSAG